MIDDIFVIDPVAHGYNFTAENHQPNRYAPVVRDVLLGLHLTWQPADITMTIEQQLTDWPVEAVAKSLFLESDVDIAAFHTLRLDSYFKDGMSSHAKALEAVRTYPKRMLAYVGVDPTMNAEDRLEDFNRQIEAIPDAVGLKIYPAQVNPLRQFKMDDPETAFPLFERVQECGLKTVAVHKAAPLGPVPMDPYKIDDLEGAADAFPDLNFEIIHAGLAFATETAWAIARFPNVYANLEGTAALVNKAPKLFEQIMAEFVMWGGTEKIVYSSGTLVLHPQPILESLMKFQFSDEICEGYGIPKLTHEDRARILGGNYARLAGLDIEELKARIADDEFARERAKTGRQAPYSNWRAMFESDGRRGTPSAAGAAR